MKSRTLFRLAFFLSSSLTVMQVVLAQGPETSSVVEDDPTLRENEMPLVEFKTGDDATDALLARSPFDVERRAFVEEAEPLAVDTAPPPPHAGPRLLGFSEKGGQRLAILENPTDAQVFLLAVGETSLLGKLVAIEGQSVELERDGLRTELHLYGDDQS